MVCTAISWSSGLGRNLGLGLDRLAMTLENSGSVARDHLASERTFLAYIRTSLAIASAGVGALLPHQLISWANAYTPGSPRAAADSNACVSAHTIARAELEAPGGCARAG